MSLSPTLAAFSTFWIFFSTLSRSSAAAPYRSLLIAYRVYLSIYVDDVIIIEAAQDMDDRIRTADITQELVAQASPLLAPFTRPAISTISTVVGTTRWVLPAFQLNQPFVRDGNDTHVGLNGTEREIGRLRLCVAQGVEQGGLAYVGQSHDTGL